MKPHTWKIVSLLVIVAVVLLWGFYPVWSYIYKDWFANTWLSEMGVFGDSFGALNTLFSGLAFTGIIISIIIQSQELSETRKDINRQIREFESQTEVLKKQAFENTFFQMLTVFRSNLDISYINERNENDDSMEVFTGRRMFNKILRKVRSMFFIRMKRKGYTPLKAIRFVYATIDSTHGESVGPYFRILYQMLRFIDESNMTHVEKKLYSNIVRSQISSHELCIAFFCGLSVHGDGLLKMYLEKYEFFEHLELRLLVPMIGGEHVAELIREYDIQAFGKTNERIIELYKNV